MATARAANGFLRQALVVVGTLFVAAVVALLTMGNTVTAQGERIDAQKQTFQSFREDVNRRFDQQAELLREILREVRK